MVVVGDMCCRGIRCSSSIAGELKSGDEANSMHNMLQLLMLIRSGMCCRGSHCSSSIADQPESANPGAGTLWPF